MAFFYIGFYRMQKNAWRVWNLFTMHLLKPNASNLLYELATSVLLVQDRRHGTMCVTHVAGLMNSLMDNSVCFN